MTIYEILLVECADQMGWRTRVSFSQKKNGQLVQRSVLLHSRGTRTGALLEVDSFIEDPDGYLEEYEADLTADRKRDLRGHDPQ